MATVNLNAPTKDVVRELLRSPRAALLREEIDTALDHEHELRERFYLELREDQKAEFINGEVVMQSPAKYQHTEAVANLAMLLRAYVHSRGLGTVGHEKMLVSLSRNDYEPDICYYRPAKSDLFKPEQMHFPAPDLVVEVLSPSTETIDRTIKYDDYAAHGVSEYWLVDPETEIVEQYGLRGDRYDLINKSRTGTITSLVVPGFEIPIRAIFDRQENLAALRRLLGG